MKKCPYCSEKIQVEAIKCRFCGETLDKKIKIMRRFSFILYRFLRDHSIVSFLIVALLSFYWMTPKYPIPNEIAWVVVTKLSEDNIPVSAKVIEFGQIKSYQQNNPNYTFLIQENYEDEILKYINEKGCCVGGRPYGEIGEGFRFDVKRTSPKQQDIKLQYYYDDGARTDWYEAYDKNIIAKYKRSFFGPGLVMFLSIVLALFLFMRWLILVLLEKILIRKTKAEEG